MSGRRLISEMRSGAKPPAAAPRTNGFIDTLLAAFAVVAVAAVGYFGITSWLGTSGPPPAHAAAIQTVAEAWTDSDRQSCRSAAQAAADSPLPIETGLANRTIATGFAGMATAIECRLSHKVMRFCTPTGKAELVAMINDYLGRYDMLTLGIGVEGAPMKIAGAIFGGEAEMGSGVHDMVQEHSLVLMAGYHARIAARMRELARDGIVTAEDFAQFFGMGIPAAITDMLAGTTAEHHSCA